MSARAVAAAAVRLRERVSCGATGHACLAPAVRRHIEAGAAARQLLRGLLADDEELHDRRLLKEAVREHPWTLRHDDAVAVLHELLSPRLHAVPRGGIELHVHTQGNEYSDF